MLTSLTKGGGGVSQLLTITDKGGGVQTPPNMADIICEQSLMLRKVTLNKKSKKSTFLSTQKSTLLKKVLF